MSAQHHESARLSRSPLWATRVQRVLSRLLLETIAGIAVFGSTCAPQAGLPSSVQYSVDGTLKPVMPTVDGLDHGAPRTVSVAIDPSGKRVDFITNEIVLHPATADELQNFINTYGATILRDGTPLVIPGPDVRGPAESSGWYLLRVDPNTPGLANASDNLGAAGKDGVFQFSSEDAARMFALAALEQGHGADLNYVGEDDADGSLEHPDDSGGHIDAAQFPYMTEDDDPAMPGDQGLSVGVIHAWNYLAYHGILDVPGVYYIPRIAIVDNGFNLDETTGVPLDGNLDFSNSPAAPLQGDVVDHDLFAGGQNTGSCGGGSCPWHGQGAFGVAEAYPRNGYGSAGVAGHFVKPIIMKSGHDTYTRADAIRSAVISGADVVSCSWHYIDSGKDELQSAVDFARSWGAVVVAAAGNGTLDAMNNLIPDDITNINIYPCKLNGVICVGAVNRDKSNAFNFGDGVSIWAPTNIFSTITPDSAATDANNTGLDELDFFGGTSASTPFIAGVIGLMKSAKSDLPIDQFLSILQSTANTSPDPKVTKGYVDAYRAVNAVLPNQPPTVIITQPVEGQVIGWANHPLLKCTYTDPEVDPTDVDRTNRFAGEVVFTTESGQELCRTSTPPYNCTSTVPAINLGAQILTATATDPFGAQSIFQIKIDVVNRPPEPSIIKPVMTDTFFTHIPVAFEAFVPDPDETIPDSAVTWTSSLDGPLGTGWRLSHSLSAGTHTITATAVDGKGASASVQTTITVLPGAGLPTPTITAPTDQSFVFAGDSVTLVGEGTDPEDGVLTGTHLEWSSDIDGVLGTGNSITVKLSAPANPCNGPNGHTITLKATDSDGHSVSVHIVIFVGIIC